jgi:hypothetical protein
MKRLFVLKPGSTAIICLLYPYNKALNNGSARITFYAIVESVTATVTTNNGVPGGYIFSYTNATGVTIEANPTLLTIENSSMTVPFISVNYSITAASDSTGNYALVAQGLCPTLLPFAITSSSPSSISAADFPDFFGEYTCPPTPGAGVGSPIVVGTSGVDVSTLIGPRGSVSSTSTTQ